MNSGARSSRANVLLALSLFKLKLRIRLVAALVGRRLMAFCGRNLLATFDLVRNELANGSRITSDSPYWKIDSDSWKMLLRPFASDAIIVKEVLVKQSYAPLLSIVKMLSVDVSSVVDAGANIGTFTLFIKRAFPDASVIALEPEAENFHLLVEIVAANSLSRTSVLQAALWGENETLRIHEGFRGCRERELSYAVMPEDPGSANSDIPGVEGISVHSLLERFGLDVVDIFKIDIEGAEASVFANRWTVEDFFRRVRICAVEIHDEVFDRMSFVRTVEQLGLQHIQWGETLYIYRPNPGIPDGQVSLS